MTSFAVFGRVRFTVVLRIAVVPGLALTAAVSCAPPTPHIDGKPGAPVAPETPWVVPPSAQTPAPHAEPLSGANLSNSLDRDSATIGATQRLSMADVIDLALRNHPATRESWATARAAAEQYGSAKGALYPSLNGSINFNHTSNNSGAAGFNDAGSAVIVGTGDSTLSGRGGGSAGASGDRTLATPALTLSYLVLDYGGRDATIESAKQHAIASSLAHNVTIQDVILQAESTVFNYLATRAMRDAQLVTVREAEADTAAAEARMRNGVANLEEVLQARTSLAQARLQLATLGGDVLSARAALAVAVGFPANVLFDMPDIPAPDSVASIAASVDTLVNRAIVERPDLAQARADARALAEDVRIARSAGYPALTLSSTLSYPRAVTGPSIGSGRNMSVVLGLQIPIFNGYSRSYDVRAARDLYEAGLARVRDTRHQVTVQVVTAHAALESARDRVLAAGELLRAAEQSAEVSLGRYREGVGTIVDVILARSALASARASEIQARWEWRTALAQLAHDVGVLDTAGRPNLPLGARQGPPR